MNLKSSLSSKALPEMLPKNLPENLPRALQRTSAELLAFSAKICFPNVVLLLSKASDWDFFCDFVIDTTLDEQALELIKVEFRRLISKKLPIEKQTMMRQNAIDFFKHKKLYLQADLLQQETQNLVELCKIGDFFDVCFDSLLSNTGDVKEFTLSEIKIFDAYYPEIGMKRVTRITGCAFIEKKALKSFLKNLEIAKKNDLLKLAKTLQLVDFEKDIYQERALWLPRGMSVRNLLEDHLRKSYLEHGFQEVSTPDVQRKDAFCRKRPSFFQEEMEYEKSICDDEVDLVFISSSIAHAEIFAKSQIKGPKRYFEMRTTETTLLSKDTDTLFKTKAYYGDQAHVFCSQKALKSELISSLQFICQMASILDLEFILCLLHEPSKSSKRSDQEMGLSLMKEAILELGIDHESMGVEYALCGPKIELRVKDLRGRWWPISMVGIDFELSDKLNLEIGKKAGSEKVHVMTQSVIVSFERLLACLLEKGHGGLPLWLAPIQVQILITDSAYESLAESLEKKLRDHGIRATALQTQGTLATKIFTCHEQKIPVSLVIGEKEASANKITVRYLQENDAPQTVEFEAFLQEFKGRLTHRN